MEIGISFVLASILALIVGFIVGILFDGIERKAFARFQNRIGPPILQPLYDVLKLLTKQTLVPRNASRFVFFLGPVLSLSAMMVAAMIVPLYGISDSYALGDVIVLLYCIALASVGLLLGASASGSPFSAVGASREITLIISFELPLVIAILSAAFYSNTFLLTSLQGQSSILLLPAAVVFLLCLVGELARAPFDIAEAHTEIVEGVYTEYSGALLAAYRLASSLKFFVLTSLFVTLFVPMPNVGVYAKLAIQLFIMLLLTMFVSFVHAISARFKIHQASRFYLGFVLLLALLQLVIIWLR